MRQTALVLYVIELLCTLVTVPLNTRPPLKTFLFTCLRRVALRVPREVRQSSGFEEHYYTNPTFTCTQGLLQTLVILLTKMVPCLLSLKIDECRVGAAVTLTASGQAMVVLP